jgi:hypothetical protein
MRWYARRFSSIVDGRNAKPRRRHSSLLHSFGEPNKKIIGKLLGGAIDEALPELRELAADLRLHCT